MYYVLVLFFSAVLQGLFSQIHGEDDTVREKAIKFLTHKLKALPEDTLDKDSQDFVVVECKKVSALSSNSAKSSLTLLHSEWS